jgi:RNA polymerase sigma-70 factor (ECF subfamily)
MNYPTSALPADELLGLDGEARQTTRSSGDEVALIERCLAGDDTAFDELVQRYQDMVFNLAYRLLGGYDESVDLSQEVFLQVYRKLGTFRRDASLRTWIYRIVINRAKNRQRWWRRRFGEMTAVSLDDVEANPNLSIVSSCTGTAGLYSLYSSYGSNRDLVAPDKALERKEVGRLLLDAIDELPFSHRTILLLKEVEGLSYDEISTTLDLPLGTVKSRLARARKSLREKLDPGLFGITEDV